MSKPVDGQTHLPFRSLAFYSCKWRTSRFVTLSSFLFSLPPANFLPFDMLQVQVQNVYTVLAFS